MLKELQFPERVAIERRYMGESYLQIAETVEVPAETIRHWFKRQGRLVEQYEEYARAMNAKIQERTEECLFESTENIARLTTQLMRLFAKRVYEGNYKPTMRDVYTAWKIQRIMQGLHTSVKPYDPRSPQYNQELLTKASAAIKDFIDTASKEPDDYVEPDQEELAKQLNL
jgi:transposase